MSAWKIWHLEFVRRKTIKKVEAFEKKQQMTMVSMKTSKNSYDAITLSVKVVFSFNGNEFLSSII